jgi:uncharacterized protein (TIGR00725 family)
MSLLPFRSVLLGVIGGRQLSPLADRMAEQLGWHIIAAGYKLVTGGRSGAGAASSRGAAEYCRSRNLPVEENVIALVPFGQKPDFVETRTIHAGKNRFERRLILMNRARSIFVVGGGQGTEEEIMHAAVDDYMAWGAANVLPVAGSGGVADRILALGRTYEDPVLNSPDPTEEKARLLVSSIDRYRFPLFKYWNVNIHEGWFSGDRHPVVVKTYQIRHYPASKIVVEGEEIAAP